jgi:hypothetical protein
MKIRLDGADVMVAIIFFGIFVVTPVCLAVRDCSLSNVEIDHASESEE